MANMAMTESGSYKYPPIQEVVCEIHLLPKNAVGEQVVKSMAKVLLADLPNQEFVPEKTLSIEITMGKAEAMEKVVGTKLVARSIDSRDIVQIGSNSLVVNRLPPYPGWADGLRSRILSRFAQLREIAPISGVAQVSLRYLDRIKVPAERWEWPTWFKVGPPVPAPLEGKDTVFNSHSQYSLGDGLGVAINFGTYPQMPLQTSEILLDIAIGWTGEAGAEDLPSLLDKIHSPHNVIFESFIQDSLRDVFVPIKK
jgi:uncharacterized protein (TIGR04255 family)